MASFSGMLQRPISAAAAVVFAAVSWDLPERFAYPKPPEPASLPEQPKPLVSQIPSSNIFSRTVLPDIKALHHMPNKLFSSSSSSSSMSISSSPALLTLYHYSRLARPPKENEFVPIVPSDSSDVLYRWHLPNPRAYRASDKSDCAAAKSQTVVVLLGWLGAKQKHLRRYAEWYTSRGFNVVTFTFPMADIISYKSGGKAEQNIEMLASHLAGWVTEESGKNLIFHTFSNTGWLTYGVLLEKFQKHDPSVMGTIKGCIVDSAPVAAPDPQVWASGFSAAFLKKQSVAAKSSSSSDASSTGTMTASPSMEPKPAVAEAALLMVLEKFFKVVLNLPAINRRLSNVLYQLSSEQPKCPQLYIYSSADRVIPATSVESFIEGQRRAGHEIRACNFVNSPHVDHFRNHPSLYSSQLTNFLDDCLPSCCNGSSQ